MHTVHMEERACDASLHPDYFVKEHYCVRCIPLTLREEKYGEIFHEEASR